MLNHHRKYRDPWLHRLTLTTWIRPAGLGSFKATHAGYSEAYDHIRRHLRKFRRQDGTASVLMIGRGSRSHWTVRLRSGFPLGFAEFCAWHDPSETLALVDPCSERRQERAPAAMRPGSRVEARSAPSLAQSALVAPSEQ